METLEIKNFLTIREATLDVRRFTILIGPQANGKSVIAKLLYFFRDFLSTHLIESIFDLENKRELQRSINSRFTEIFPYYTWCYQDFILTYRSNDFTFTLTKMNRRTGRSTLKLDYSQNFSRVFNNTKLQFKRKIENSETSDVDTRTARYEIFRNVLGDFLYIPSIISIFNQSFFVPATRSFFATLQKNLFSFLANDIVIDPLIQEFGSIYERSKSQYNNHLFSKEESTEITKSIDKIKKEMETILAGKYIHRNDEDWIQSENHRVKLFHASSGQQEALPMLVVLASRLRFGPLPRTTTFFIEEPEAHLFPILQKSLVHIFAILYNIFNNNFVLTTHSPYILTAINNLIMASNIVREGSKEAVSEVLNIVTDDLLIQYEDVSAYTIQDGKLESIMNPETHLIGSSIIDSVSDEFDHVFDRLMEIQVCG